jgi:dsDNA-binding SOS-regulon protein
MINLSDEERQRFSLWLKQDAESNKLILEQLKKDSSSNIFDR